MEKDLNEMIETKRSMRPGPELSALLADMVKKHAELEAAAKDREEELEHMRFQHPEKGDLAKREYERYVAPTLMQMESSHGLEGKLDRLKLAVEHKYRIEPRVAAGAKASKKDGLREPASAAPEEERIVFKK